MSRNLDLVPGSSFNSLPPSSVTGLVRIPTLYLWWSKSIFVPLSRLSPSLALGLDLNLNLHHHHYRWSRDESPSIASPPLLYPTWLAGFCFSHPVCRSSSWPHLISVVIPTNPQNLATMPFSTDSRPPSRGSNGGNTHSHSHSHQSMPNAKPRISQADTRRLEELFK